MALGETLRAFRGPGAGAHPTRDSLTPDNDGCAAARMVLPLWAQSEHPEAAGRGRRLSLRLRCLRRRAAILDNCPRQAAFGGALQPVDQRLEVRPWNLRDRRRLLC